MAGEGELLWLLTLYVGGATPHSTAAIATIRKICDEDLAGRVDLTVVDVHLDPEQVRRDNIVAVPTLVKHQPEPRCYLVGDLNDRERVLAGLDLAPHVQREGQA